MRRILFFVVCGFLFGDKIARAQPPIQPIHVPAGTVVTFYLQTRLNPENGSAIDLLPKGSVLKIKILDTIDSDLTRDGAEFRGVVVTPLLSKGDVIIHAEAKVRGLFALLRSRSHPDGFRYDLLITGITDGGKLFQLTASMNPSFRDPSPQLEAKSAGGAGESDGRKRSNSGVAHR
jgi:hypothetical protein